MKEYLNYLGKNKIPFFFSIGYDTTKSYIIPLEQLDVDIKFEIDGFCSGAKSIPIHNKKFTFDKYPISFATYKKRFDALQKEIRNGNTYLANLTTKTPLKTNATLYELYLNSQAKFKLYFKDEFIVFSPERFVKIQNNTICTYPMKGTIDANLPNAKETILNSKKELAEHTMVVDLLRNDLSIVASKVRVEDFRYITKIKTNNKELLQVSSKIVGDLKEDWRDFLGEIMLSLLPAGSISGTPKKNSCKILEQTEEYNRGYFSGVFGYFDGDVLDSAVMIRYIEKSGEELFFKSGGGITSDSNAIDEYNEMIDKVYVPIY